MNRIVTFPEPFRIRISLSRTRTIRLCMLVVLTSQPECIRTASGLDIRIFETALPTRRSGPESSIQRPSWSYRLAQIRSGRTPGANIFCSGPNFLAPQTTFQTDKQVKYDGSRTLGSHIIRYGFGYNRLLGGGLAEFLALAPAVGGQNLVLGGVSSNPLDYAVSDVILANGIGFSSENPAFGQPGGRLGPEIAYLFTLAIHGK